MRRREFITLLGGAAAWPAAAYSQQPVRRSRIGVLISNLEHDPESVARARALEKGLQKLGLTTARNINIDYFWNVASPPQIRKSVQELMDLRPDVILAHTPAMLVALQEATRTTPIVFVQGADPVALGLLPNLASPNGNVTGFMLMEPSLGGKWLQLLRDVAPQIAKAFVLQDPQNPSSSGFLRAVQSVAASIGVEVHPASIHDLADLERSAEAAAGTSAGLIVLPSPEATVQRQRVIDIALRHRLPAIYPFKFFVSSGGLLFYGADNVDQWRQAAAYIDRIIAGTQPRDLPVQLPTKFDLVINLKTANLLGLDIPRDVLLLADEMIE